MFDVLKKTEKYKVRCFNDKYNQNKSKMGDIKSPSSPLKQKMSLPEEEGHLKSSSVMLPRVNIDSSYQDIDYD
jgi:hypothetical protein